MHPLQKITKLSLCSVLQNKPLPVTIMVKRSVVDPDPHPFGNLDPDPHQSNKLDPDPQQLQMTSENVWTMSLFEHFKQGVEPLFGSLDLDPDPEPHQGEESDPNQHKITSKIRQNRHWWRSVKRGYSLGRATGRSWVQAPAAILCSIRKLVLTQVPYDVDSSQCFCAG